MCDTLAVLKHLSKFPSGMTFTEIQRFIVESNGLDFDKRIVVNPWEVEAGKAPKHRRQYRGYWCDRLCTSARYVVSYNSYGHAFGGWKPVPGILEKFTDKIGKHYVLKPDVAAIVRRDF